MSTAALRFFETMDSFKPDAGVCGSRKRLPFTDFQIELGKQMHAGVVTANDDGVAEVLSQQIHEHAPPLAVEPAHATNVSLIVTLIQEIGKGILLDRRTLPVGEKLSAREHSHE